jgi:hypothetical protein
MGNIAPYRPGQLSIFGPSPVVTGEDANAYNALLTQVSKEVQPSTTVERIWVREVVDDTWELLRFRRAVTNLISYAIPFSLQQVLAQIVGVSTNSSWVNEIVKKWEEQKLSAINRVKDLLASKWKPFDAVIAITLADKLDTVERLEHLITIAKGRRDATLREIDRRRAAFGQILRDKVREVEDAEFKTVEPKAMTDSRTDGKSSAADRLSTL